MSINVEPPAPPKPRFRVAASILTRSAAFKKLARWAFGVCDGDNTGRVGKAELYAGILLVHVKLAKYAGPAACYPPSRQVVEKLFEATDEDKSGSIDEAEFMYIMQVCSAHIASRVLVYYSILILLVPQLADAIVRIVFSLDDLMGWSVSYPELTVFNWIEKFLPWNKVAENIISLAFFMLVIPLLFNMIDDTSERVAREITASDDEKKAD